MFLILSLSAQDKPVIACIQLGATSEWSVAQTFSIKEEADRRGIRLLFYDAQLKQENQIRAMRSFIAQKVDAIILIPVMETGWDIVLQEAKDAGIPVFILDCKIQVSDPLLYVTALILDFYSQGREAAQWLMQELDGEGNISEMYGTPGSDAAVLRSSGFMDLIADYPEIKVVVSENADFTRVRGREVMESWLGRDLYIDAVFTHNDDMALGAIAAIKEAGLIPGKDIIIVSIDAVRPALEAIIKGELNCTVESSPHYGPKVFEAIELYLAEQVLPKTIMQTGKVFTRVNAAAALSDRMY